MSGEIGKIFEKKVDLRTEPNFEVAPFLLLASREHLSEEEGARLVDLAPKGIEEWTYLRDISEKLHVLPFLHHHVVRFKLLSEEQIGALGLKQAAMNSTMRWLLVLAAQRNFLEKCLEPLNVRNVFLKGLTLCEIYETPSLRTSRDIDVLVDPADFGDILSLAKQNGYKIMLDPKRGIFAQTEDEEKFAEFFKSDLAVISPEGILIEVHSNIDADLFKVSLEEVFATCQSVHLGGKDFNVMNYDILIPYLCSHHSRHFWDSLKWLADMSALRHYYRANAAAVDGIAREYGLEDVLKVSFGFEAATRSDTSDPASWPEDPRVRQLLRLSMLRIGNHNAHSEEIVSEIASLPRWWAPAASRMSYLLRQANRSFKPNIKDYFLLKLPYELRWLYFISSFFRFCGRQISMAFSWLKKLLVPAGLR